MSNATTTYFSNTVSFKGPVLESVFRFPHSILRQGLQRFLETLLLLKRSLHNGAHFSSITVSNFDIELALTSNMFDALSPIMLIFQDEAGIAICTYLGCVPAMLCFRCVATSISTLVSQEIDRSFMATLRSVIPLTAIPSSRSAAFIRSRVDRIRDNRRIPDPLTLAYVEIQLRLQSWIALHSNGVLLRELVSRVLQNVGCWCVNLQWPWIVQKLLCFFPAWVQPSSLGIRLRHDRAGDFVRMRDMGSRNVRMTTKQILVTCLALVMFPSDSDVEFSTDVESNDSA